MIESVRGEDGWQTELVPFAASFGNDPGARPTVALVTGGELVVWADVHRRVPGYPAEVAGVLADAVGAAIERVGGTPSRIEARYAEVVSALRDRLDGLGVEVSLARRLPDLDAVATGMVQRLEGRSPDDPGLSRPCTSSPETWEGWMLPRSMVAELFDAAAAYYRASPWRGAGRRGTPGGRDSGGPALGGQRARGGRDQAWTLHLLRP